MDLYQNILRRPRQLCIITERKYLLVFFGLSKLGKLEQKNFLEKVSDIENRAEKSRSREKSCAALSERDIFCVQGSKLQKNAALEFCFSTITFRLYYGLYFKFKLSKIVEIFKMHKTVFIFDFINNNIAYELKKTFST